MVRAAAAVMVQSLGERGLVLLERTLDERQAVLEYARARRSVVTVNGSPSCVGPGLRGVPLGLRRVRRRRGRLPAAVARRRSSAWIWLPGLGAETQFPAAAVELILADQPVVVAKQA